MKAAELAIEALRHLKAALPPGHSVVVLLFDDHEQSALCVSSEPYKQALERVREWVHAQDTQDSSMPQA